MTLTFHGFNTHPGYAKGRMINAIKLASDFVHRLPSDRLSPETTEGLDGFVHPYVMQASLEQTAVKLLIRDFHGDGMRVNGQFVKRLADQPTTCYVGTCLT